MNRIGLSDIQFNKHCYCKFYCLNVYIIFSLYLPERVRRAYILVPYNLQLLVTRMYGNHTVCGAASVQQVVSAAASHTTQGAKYSRISRASHDGKLITCCALRCDRSTRVPVKHTLQFRLRLPKHRLLRSSQESRCHFYLFVVADFVYVVCNIFTFHVTSFKHISLSL